MAYAQQVAGLSGQDRARFDEALSTDPVFVGHANRTMSALFGEGS